ncbi:MAG: Gfo/Idh/MocA family oxidoreductase, partial [Firmicutes bacterium]|nr:Gfo/Idh/MocA family oxidoreductase [Bacillota bacterium]
MAKTPLVRMVIVGSGGFGRHHVRQILQQQDTTRIAMICETSPDEYEKAAALFTEAGLKPPPNEPNLHTLLDKHASKLDAALIVTPHVFHHDHVKACLEAGLDVLVEKPMVMNAAEAESLIEMRDRTGRLLVVGFPGSLSPQIREAVRLIQAGKLGEVTNISAVVWQGWYLHAGSWRGEPEKSGGGFMFDTGAHVLNTVADLAGEDFAEVVAWQDNRNQKVDILSAIMARTVSGKFITINAAGATIQTCASDVRVFGTEGIIRTGMWGERLLMQANGEDELVPVEVAPSMGVWEQFLAVRAGRIPNLCPPEAGLRMARLWDAIRASAAQGGRP